MSTIAGTDFHVFEHEVTHLERQACVADTGVRPMDIRGPVRRRPTWTPVRSCPSRSLPLSPDSRLVRGAGAPPAFPASARRWHFNLPEQAVPGGAAVEPLVRIDEDGVVIEALRLADDRSDPKSRCPSARSRF